VIILEDHTDYIIVLAVFGLLLSFVAVISPANDQGAITGNVVTQTTCKQMCINPSSYIPWGAANQQDCVKKCCASGKLQCGQSLPPTTSQGMVKVRRIKQVSSIF